MQLHGYISTSGETKTQLQVSEFNIHASKPCTYSYACPPVTVVTKYVRGQLEDMSMQSVHTWSHKQTK